jgi:hypothetical protein
MNEEDIMTERMISKGISRGLRIAVMVIVACAVFGFVVMSLWNWLMPPLFGWRTIGFWQAIGLVLLSKILFGGFRGGWGRGRHWRRGMRERWENMTPEQREQMRERLQACCGPRTTRPHDAGSGTAEAPRA